MDSLAYRSTKQTRSTWLGNAHPVAVQSFSRCVLCRWISPFAQNLCVTLGPRGVAAAQQWCSLCRACSVLSVSGYSIWETCPKAACLAHYSPGCSSWEWHPTSQQCWGGSFSTQAPWLRTAALSVSNCHTGGSQIQWLWQSPFPAEPQAAAACFRSGFMILKWRHPIQQAFPNALHAWEGLSSPLPVL